VDFSNETVVENLRPSAWFSPRELVPGKAVHRRSGARRGTASTSAAVGVL
jgi:hypothetical protein